MPEYPVTGVTETLYQLRTTVGNPLHIIYVVAGIVLINILSDSTWDKLVMQALLVFQLKQAIN